MVDNRLLIEAEDEEEGGGDGGFSSKPRVSVERNRRSLKLSSSFIADGLSPKSKSLYTKLPSQPLNLSVLKLDGSSFVAGWVWVVASCYLPVAGGQWMALGGWWFKERD
ncbi:hypothetical protein CMV_026226 [Castanea mollissima]|uniref:Uncharacterized protein n=1 Tax=Castanea mollissima TaxID=60419 RepID=A0A8J4Q867_9ROSI|nr:hypothetical protein CMV_026226 [Castanea mollissima]